MKNKFFTRCSSVRLHPASFLMLLFLLTSVSLTSRAQDFSRSFKVLPDSSSVDIITKNGSVTVVPGESSVVQLIARRTGGEINATQASPQGRVKIEITDNDVIELTLTVPASASLNVLCVKCYVTVKGLRGAIKTSTTEGDIQLTGIRSALVEARSMSGNVSYSGEILPSGSYLLKSFSGHVDAFLPAGSKFKLDATSVRGGIEIEPSDFQLTMQKQTPQFVHGLVGTGGATVTLWTQEGSIRVKKK